MMTNLQRVDTWSKRVWTSRMGEVTRIPVLGAPRGGHGGTAWSLPFADKQMRQPQDGALEKRSRLASITSHTHGDGLNEPEDARLTGGTRSLSRRLLGLNMGKISRKAPMVAPSLTVRSNLA